jgi:hypothetical protein
VRPEVRLARLELDAAGTLRREPPRPVDHRPPDYDANFDFHTVFYDCFISADGRRLVCIGPPLANLAKAVLPKVTSAFHKPAFAWAKVRRFDRVSELLFQPRRTDAVFGDGIFEQSRIAAQPNHCDWFRGRRAVVTMSKDNHLEWIHDWVEFYARRHGCDAVLFYDNGSTQYEPAQVWERIAAVPGIEVAVVVTWPYRLGPRGAAPPLKTWTGPHGVSHEVWDSDFAQYGMLEHARHRFLSLAAAVLNGDIDELVITLSRQSIFDLVQESRTGYLSFGGIWIENAAENDPGEARRHHHYVYRRVPEPRWTAAKWAVVPSRCSLRAQWCVHWIAGMTADAKLSPRALLRHFVAINTNWKHQRWVPEQPGAGHEVDEELVQWMGSSDADHAVQSGGDGAAEPGRACRGGPSHLEATATERPDCRGQQRTIAKREGGSRRPPQ